MEDTSILESLGVNFRELDGIGANHWQNFEKESDHFMDFMDEHGLVSYWSCYGLGIRMDQRTPFEVEGKTVVYKVHWGDKEVRHKIEGPTWGDVYIAADRCIRESGDDHHVFIENLDENEFDENGEMELFTGS